MAMDTDPAERRDGELRTVLLLTASTFVLGLFLTQASKGNVGGPDVFRLLHIAQMAQTPWRDVPVEYAPGEFIMIRGLFDTGLETAAIRLALLAFAGHLATWGATRWGWGRRAGEHYLIATLPLLLLMVERLDTVPVALAAWGLAFAVRGRARGAGVLLALAVLTKLWPLVLLPGLVLRGGRRASAWFTAILAGGGLAWVAYGGTGAPGQVIGFRGAAGWEAGSTVGVIVWVLGGGPLRQEAGSARVGTAATWARVLLGLVLLALLAVIWLRARAREDDPGGRPALVSVAALLLCSPLFSTQYVMWLLPWAGITSARDRDRGALGAVLLVGAATASIDLWGYDPGMEAATQIATLIRLAALGWLVGREGVTGLRPRPAPATPRPRASSPQRSAG